MAYVSREDIRTMFKLLKATGPVVDIEDFTFKGTTNQDPEKCIIFYKGERIVRRPFDDLTPQYILDLIDIPSTYDNDTTVGEELQWETDEQTQHLREWETPFDGNSVYIKVERQDREKAFEVHAPIEDKSKWTRITSRLENDVANEGREFEKMETAFVYAVNYMRTYDPYELDRLVRMNSVARDKFLDITGVGEKTVTKVVDEDHIRTYEEFKDNISILPRNYRETAKSDIESKIESEESIRKNSHVQKVSAHLTAENI